MNCKLCSATPSLLLGGSASIPSASPLASQLGFHQGYLANAHSVVSETLRTTPAAFHGPLASFHACFRKRRRFWPLLFHWNTGDRTCDSSITGPKFYCAGRAGSRTREAGIAAIARLLAISRHGLIHQPLVACNLIGQAKTGFSLQGLSWLNRSPRRTAAYPARRERRGLLPRELRVPGPSRMVPASP
jgi:hypothetical protein